MYYGGKTDRLKDIFGKKIILDRDRLMVGDCSYPIIDDVIILLEPSRYPDSVKQRVDSRKDGLKGESSDFASDIQFTFSREWQAFPHIIPEHEREFHHYFDLINLEDMKDLRVCDLGCGIGRWSHFLQARCRELILLDFSEAIFIARRNLAHADNALFFMGDLKRLPFRRDFADFLFSLGVLHHLPTPALDEVRALKKCAPRLLIYLYYALDNRPFYFRILFHVIDILRRTVSSYRNPYFRFFFAWIFTLAVYKPMVFMGSLVRPLGFENRIPLYETYHCKGLQRIRQDVYDRFFTTIEQRFSREQIMMLEDTFSRVDVSEGPPYWHFVCER